MVRWACLAVLSAAMLAVIASRLGRAEEAVTIQINGLDASVFPTLRATVTVVDASQRPILGLPADAFRATVNGNTIPISSITSSNDAGLGIGVVLAFDVSGSMEGAALAEARSAGRALIEQLGPEDEVAVLAFSDVPRVVLPPTRDRQALAAAIDGLVAGGNTALYRAVLDSAGLAQGVDLPRRAVVLLSDGQDFGGLSGVDAAGSLAAVRERGVPFFVVGLGEAIDQPYLEELARSAQGQLLLAPAPEALQGLYQTLGSILRHQYVLTLDGSPLRQGAGQNLRIEVNASGATASAEVPLVLAPAPAPVNPATTARPSPPPARPAASEVQAGSSYPLLVIAGAGGALALALVAAAGGFLLWRRRRGRDQLDVRRPQQGAREPLFPGREPLSPAEAPAAWLEMLTPAADQTFPLGEWPTTIGFTSDCAIRLPDGPSSGLERVRVWRREGRYMLHNLSRLGTVCVAGRPVSWAVLEDGDELEIGSCRLVFRDRAARDSAEF